MIEKKTKTLAETIVDEALALSPEFAEVKSAVLQGLGATTMLVEHQKIHTNEMTRMANIILTLTSMVKDHESTIVQLRTMMANSSSSSSMSMPSLNGKKISKVN